MFSRNLSTGTATTASIFTFDTVNNLLTVTQVVGAIPAGDFTGQNVQNLTLNFSTSDLDPLNFFAQTCVIDLTNMANTTWGAGPTGSISVSFTQNGATRTPVLALVRKLR